MTSMLKNVDVAVFDYLKAVDDGDVPGRRATATTSRSTASATPPPVDRSTTSPSELDEYKQQIIDGEIKVPTDPPDPAAREHPLAREPAARARPGPRASSHGYRVAGICHEEVTATCPSTAPRRADAEARHRATVAVRLRGITKRFPGVVANHDVNIDVRRGTDPRDRRRERRRQVDADEDPLRHAAARLRARSRSTASEVTLHVAGRRHRGRRRHGLPALHARRQPHRARERRPRRREAARHRRRGARRDHARSPTPTASDIEPDRLVEDLGVGDRQRVEILKVLYRGARDPHPRRADRGAGAAGGRRAVRQPARAQGRGPHGHLHLPQARRGARRSPTRSP